MNDARLKLTQSLVSAATVWNGRLLNPNGSIPDTTYMTVSVHINEMLLVFKNVTTFVLLKTLEKRRRTGVEVRFLQDPKARYRERQSVFYVEFVIY